MIRTLLRIIHLRLIPGAQRRSNERARQARAERRLADENALERAYRRAGQDGWMLSPEELRERGLL